MAPKKKEVQQEVVAPVEEAPVAEQEITPDNLFDELVSAAGEEKTGFRGEILYEFHSSNQAFCQEICLNEEKTVIFVRLMNYVLQTLKKPSSMSPFAGEALLVDEVLAEFQRLIMACGSKDEITTVCDLLGGKSTVKPVTFSTAEIVQLSEFAVRTFFSHFKLYQYVMVYPRHTEIDEIELTVAQPLRLPDLNTSVELACREIEGKVLSEEPAAPSVATPSTAVKSK